MELIANLFRKSYGFEIKREYVEGFKTKLAPNMQTTIFQQKNEKAGIQQSAFEIMEVIA